MLDGTNVAYLYDGSFDGLMTAVFDSFLFKQTPIDIVCDAGLLPYRTVVTDSVKAQRVQVSIREKMGDETLENVKVTYLSDSPGKEIKLLHYLRLGYRVKRKLNSYLGDEYVSFVVKTAKYVFREAHRIKEFLRFSDSNGILTSVINPSCMVLPLISRHFALRFPAENFLVYDETHNMALVYFDKVSRIIPVEEYVQPEADAEEMKYRKLFKLFYDTIEIKPRHNERCRMNFMPKRFWRNMTEFTTEFDESNLLNK